MRCHTEHHCGLFPSLLRHQEAVLPKDERQPQGKELCSNVEGGRMAEGEAEESTLMGNHSSFQNRQFRGIEQEYLYVHI